MKSKSIQSIPTADANVISGGAVAALNRPGPATEQTYKDTEHRLYVEGYTWQSTTETCDYSYPLASEAKALVAAGRFTLADAKAIAGDFQELTMAEVVITCKHVREVRSVLKLA